MFLLAAAGLPENDRAEFARRKLGDFARFDFSRDAILPDGGTARVGFSLVFAARADWPEAAFFTCQQHAPEHFWKPAFQRHATPASHTGSAARIGQRRTSSLSLCQKEEEEV